MREWLWTSVKKAGHLDCFLGHVLQVTNNILCFPVEEQVRGTLLESPTNLLFVRP